MTHLSLHGKDDGKGNVILLFLIILSSRESGCGSKDSGSLRSSVPPTEEIAFHSHLAHHELTMPGFGSRSGQSWTTRHNRMSRVIQVHGSRWIERVG